MKLPQGRHMAESSKFRFVHDPNQDVEGDLERILRLLEHARELGLTVELVDTNRISEEERMKLYFDSVVGSVIQKAAIRRVFGSNRNPGLMFGRSVPALQIIKDGLCVDVYPQKRSIVDGQERTILTYLEGSLKALELHSSERYLDHARFSFEHDLHRAAVLYCLLALDAFIWRRLWGRKDLDWVGPDGRRYKHSSVDFVYSYSRRTREMYSYPEQYDVIKKNNERLFKQLSDSDSFLLRQAVKIGLVNPDEANLVKRLRTLRNFCSHFNPFEKTLDRFNEAVESLGISRPANAEDLKELAKLAIEKTSELLKLWENRVVT
jgi:hypothetical protein